MIETPCRFCERPATNATGWPVCRACYENGIYREWLRRELHESVRGSDAAKALEDAIRTCFGEKWLVVPHRVPA
jgi:hypothetical protein